MKKYTATEQQIETLVEKGCKVWSTEDKKYVRMYLDLEKLGLLELWHYNTGNICHAELLGKEISHGKAYALTDCKIFVDMKTNKVVVQKAEGKVYELLDEALSYLFGEGEE